MAGDMALQQAVALHRTTLSGGRFSLRTLRRLDGQEITGHPGSDEGQLQPIDTSRARTYKTVQGALDLWTFSLKRIPYTFDWLFIKRTPQERFIPAPSKNMPLAFRNSRLPRYCTKGTNRLLAVNGLRNTLKRLQFGVERASTSEGKLEASPQ
jgi:hypothetical protein